VLRIPSPALQRTLPRPSENLISQISATAATPIAYSSGSRPRPSCLCQRHLLDEADRNYVFVHAAGKKARYPIHSRSSRHLDPKLFVRINRGTSSASTPSVNSNLVPRRIQSYPARQRELRWSAATSPRLNSSSFRSPAAHRHLPTSALGASRGAPFGFKGGV